MDFIKDIFHLYHPDVKKLTSFGFTLNNDIYHYEKDLNDEFIIKIDIKGEEINAKVYDKAFNEEYNLIFMDRVVGEFVGKIREEYQKALIEIRDNCFYQTMFNSLQANRLASYVKQEYDIEPDFPWAKYPSFGVIRNKDNNLWFGLFGEVEDDKLAPNVKGHVIINLKPEKHLHDDLLKVKGIYPAWHMNKKNWISVSLNDTLSDEFIQSLIDSSYNETVGKQVKKVYPRKKKRP